MRSHSLDLIKSLFISNSSPPVKNQRKVVYYGLSYGLTYRVPYGVSYGVAYGVF